MNQDECLKKLEYIRWGTNPRCPYCNSSRATDIPQESRYHCNECNTTYSVTVGTVFHSTHLQLGVWFHAIYLILSSRGQTSGRQLGLYLGLNKNTACRISNRIHFAMADPEQRRMLLEIVDVIEKENLEELGIYGRS